MWSVYVIICYKNVWVKNTDTILFSNHLCWKENLLDWDPMELSRKAAMNFNKTVAAPKLLPLLNRSSCWKVFVLHYQPNVQDKWAFHSSTLTTKFSFCMFIFSMWYIMSCHNTKDNAGLYRFTYLFLKQSQWYSYLFFFYTS